MVFEFFITDWLSNVKSEAIGAVMKGLRSIFYSIISMLYEFIIRLYWLFNTLCTGRLLDNSVMQELSKRVGLILGVVMLFYVVFSFIKMLVDPDTISDNTKGAGSVIKKCIIVIIMLGISSFVFDTLYMVQRVVVQNNIISKIFLPYDIDTENFGGVLSAELLSSFYKISDSIPSDDKKSNSDVQICQQVVYTLQDKIVEEADFELGNTCLNESIKVAQDDGEDHEITMIDFNWLIGIAAGIAVIYFLIIYCIQVGVRMVQLAVLEIISPMAIVSYLAPKQDTMFSKWSKLYISTYIDVFIRIAIINFVVFLIATIFDTNGGWTFWESLDNPEHKSVIVITMVIALLAFAKKAPDLIKDLFPTGSSKLGFGSMHMKDFVGLQRGINTAASLGTGAAIGFLGGAVSNGVAAYKKDGSKLSALRHGLGGALGGGITGAFHGIDNGFKSKNLGGAINSSFREQRSRNFRAASAISQGSTFKGRLGSSARRLFGQNTRAENMKSNVESLNEYSKYFDKMKEIADRTKTVKNLKESWENARDSGTATAQEISNKKKLYESAQKSVINDALKNDFKNSSFAGVDQSALNDMSTVKEMMNRSYDNNRELFDESGISRVETTTNFDNLKAYSGISKSTSFRIENSEEYVRRNADDEYAFLPPDEQLRRKK